MALKLKSITVLTCAGIVAFSFPASATRKADCESGLQQAQADFKNATLDRGKIDKLRRTLANAAKLQKEGKYKKCIKAANKVKEALGTK